MTSTTTTTTTTGTTTTTSASPARVLGAALLAAALTGSVNAGLAAGAVALGVRPTMQLTPAVDALFSVVASVAGAIGWQILRRRAADPRRLLTRLVPAVLALSFVPDALLAVATISSTGIAPVLVVALLHVTTIAVAVGVYARVLPVPARPSGAR